MASFRMLLKVLPVACGIAAIVGLTLLPTDARAATVVVTPSNMGNWAFNNRDATGTIIGGNPTGSGSMVNGPASPPLGTGSANLQTGNGVVGGDAAWELRNSGYVGTALSSITALSYSTYATENNGQQLPFLVLYLSNGNRLWFEPTYSSATQPAVALDTWQSWDAFAGGWYDDAGSGGSGPSIDAVISWNDIVAANAGATIVNSGDGLGGVRISIGFASPADKFNTYVDAFRINDTTYDFEAAAATPIPATLPLFSSGLGLIGFLSWRKKRRRAAAA